jgi:hypothetical protein
VSFAQGWRTNWAAVQILLRECQCFATMSSSTNSSGTTTTTLLIIPRSALATERPSVTLSFFQFQQGIVGTNTYPILSATTPAQGLWLPGVRAVRVQEVDLISKTKNQKDVTNSSAQPPQSLQGPGDAAQAGSPNLPDPDPNNPINVFRRPGNPNNKTALEPLDVETVGCPTLFPGQVVAIQGLGFRLSGNYGIFKVTHTIGPGGYTTLLHLINGTNSFLSKLFAQQNSTPPNTQQAAQDGSTTNKSASGD